MSPWAGAGYAWEYLEQVFVPNSVWLNSSCLVAVRVEKVEDVGEVVFCLAAAEQVQEDQHVGHRWKKSETELANFIKLLQMSENVSNQRQYSLCYVVVFGAWVLFFLLVLSLFWKPSSWVCKCVLSNFYIQS